MLTTMRCTRLLQKGSLKIQTQKLIPHVATNQFMRSISDPNKMPSWANQVEKDRAKNLGNVLWKILAASLVASVLLLAFFQNEKKNKALKENRLRSAGTAQIGGNWSMVDHHGVPVSRATFQGKYVLIYFGFTFCPDICPEELRKMKLVIDGLDEKYGEVFQPVFVSLDPWRDSIDQIDRYVKQFSPRLIGLTGTPEQCEIMAHNFRVYSASDRSSDKRSADADYVVDHSIFMYLMDSQGQFAEFFAVDKEPDYIIHSMEKHLAARGKIQPSLWWRVKEFFTID